MITFLLVSSCILLITLIVLFIIVIKKMIPFLNYIINTQNTIHLIFLKIDQVDLKLVFRTDDLVLFIWNDLKKILLSLRMYI